VLFSATVATVMATVAAGIPAMAAESAAWPRALEASDFRDFNPVLADLGRLLFYDKILSGNRNIACGTCHHHDLGGADGLSLGIGEGGVGLGPRRSAGAGASRIKKRVPRNAPALWNVGAKSVTALFHDGRVEISDIYGNGFNTPAQEWLPAGLRGILEWRSHDSAFDAFLRGDEAALPAAAKRGAKLFYGKAGCARCHAGPLLTDHKFHALALPHFGPGRTRPWDPIARDVGRMGVSDRLQDAYRFRTPSLRNVALTAPYGHNGAYSTLRGIIRHHLDPARAFDAWRPALARLPAAPHLDAGDFIALQDARERARLRARIDIAPARLSAADIDALVAFMHSLTGRESRFGRRGRPARVPSGLAVDSVD